MIRYLEDICVKLKTKIDREIMKKICYENSNQQKASDGAILMAK